MCIFELSLVLEDAYRQRDQSKNMGNMLAYRTYCDLIIKLQKQIDEQKKQKIF